MTLLLFNIFMFFMVRIDVGRYEHQITPLTIIGTIYTVLIDLNNLLLCNIYNYYTVEDHVLWVLLVFFFMIFVIDLFFGTIFRSAPKIDTSITVRFQSYRIVTMLFVIGVIAYSIQFLRLYSSRGLDIKGANDGILGHLSSFAFILGPVAFDLAIQSRNKIRIVFAALFNLLVLTISVLFGGKYVVFINLTYFILYFLLKRNRKIEIGKIIRIAIILGLVVVGVFFIIYYVIPRVTGQYKATTEFATQHMFDYLIGSISANNTTVNRAGGGNPNTSFAVFINIGKALIGDQNYVSSIFPFIFPIRGTYMTNVSGFFGETIYNLGIGGALVYTLVLFVIINIFFFEYRAKNMFYLSFCYSCAMTVFLFFCNFISVSGVVLPLIMAFVIDILSMCRFGNHHI